MKRLLYPTDLSENSDLALTHIIQMCSNLGGELHILHVIEKLQLYVIRKNESTSSFKDKDYEGEILAATSRLESICERCSQKKISCVSHVSIGDPAKEILKYIEQQKINVVFVALNRKKDHPQGDAVTAKIVKKSAAMVVTVPVTFETYNGKT